MGQRLKYYTSGELDQIASLRAQGFNWPTISARMGRSQKSLMQPHMRAKKPIDKRHAENEAIIAEFEAGKTATEIAKARGWSLSRVLMRMTRAGLDAEMRRLTQPIPTSSMDSANG